MPTLGVNIDHVATLREVRHGTEPQPVFAALLAQSAGADSIVAHLREDRRHVREKDLSLLKRVINRKLNMEMSIAEEIVDIACKVKPEQATLVPERRQELTTEGGLDAARHLRAVAKVVGRLEKKGIAVSLFIDPDKAQIDASRKMGVRMVELHTGRYADAKNMSQRRKFLKELEAAAAYAAEGGLQVFAGHGLNYYNVAPVARLKHVEELNIGYSIVCRAVLVGLYQAVTEMKALIHS